MQIVNVICGEYQAYFQTDGNQVLTPTWNGSSVTCQPISGLPLINSGSAGLHGAIFLDQSGNAWTTGDNTYGQAGNGQIGGTLTAPFKIIKDVNGNPFTNLAQVVQWAFTSFAVKSDGTVWMWGSDSIGIFNGSNIVLPTQITISSSAQIKKMVGGNPLLFLDTAGRVWQWVTGTKAANIVPLPSNATDIANSSQNASVAIVGQQAYAWGQSVWGLTGTPTLQNWGSILQMVGNENTLHWVDTNGNLWGLGDNAQGNIGNGVEINYSVINPPNGLYQWSWLANQLMVTTPVQVLPGTKFQKVCTQNADAFYVYAQDTSGNWYAWGRNKGGVIITSLIADSNTQAQYPNIQDLPNPTKVTPLVTAGTYTSNLTLLKQLYAQNTGFPLPGSTTTTTSTTKGTSTSTTTSTTTTSSTTRGTSTTSTTTTSTSTQAPKIPYITLYTDGTWVKV